MKGLSINKYFKEFKTMNKIILSFLLALTTVAVNANNFENKEFHIDGSKGKLFSILQYPAEVEHNVKFPLVILCHGFMGNCQSPLEETLSEDIVSNGMAALRFDFNGHGKSEGLFQEMTVPNEIEDLEKVIDWARKQPWVESISLVGHSQGGVVVSMVAGELGDSIIKSEVLMAPAAVLRDDALRGNTMGAIYNPWNLETEYVELPFSPQGKNILLGKEYIETAMSLPIYETARNYTGPTLILHGTHDNVVPYTYGLRYNEEIKGSELKLIDGEGHGFNNSLKESCQYIADWFKNVLQPQPVTPVKI